MKFYYWCREAVRSIGLRLILVLAGYVLLSMLAIGLTDAWMGALARQNAYLTYARDTVMLISELRTRMHEAESAQRGYLISLQNKYLPVNEKAIEPQINSMQQVLRALEKHVDASGEAEQRYAELLKDIAADVEGKSAELQMSVTLAHKGNMEAPMQMVNAEESQQRMNQFMQRTQAFMDSMNKDIARMMERRANTMAAGRFSVAASILLVLVLLVLSVKKLVEEIVDRDRLSKKLETDVVNFEQKLEERTSMLKTLAVDYQYDVERERRKLARELHDEMGSILTATKMDISWVLRKIKDASPEASEKLNRTLRYLDQGIELKRRVVQDLHPSLLTTFGLIPALKALIESAADRNQWELDMELPDEGTPISEALGLIAYRLVQETLTNATKYAQATKVSVHLQVDDRYLKLEIADNGKGMDLTQGYEVTHGLKGMQHRVTAIGGKMQIDSEPGKGMFTLALIPLNAAAESRTASAAD
ncbi:MAG TPA: histidine kinase [Methylophilaceae bacterium]|nr:histidine kinase [Methylophilaceae bacterium]